MQIKWQLKIFLSPILQVIVLVLVGKKPHFKYSCIHTFHDLHDYGKETILTNDRRHYDSVALHSMERGGAHRSG